MYRTDLFQEYIRHQFLKSYYRISCRELQVFCENLYCECLIYTVCIEFPDSQFWNLNNPDDNANSNIVLGPSDTGCLSISELGFRMKQRVQISTYHVQLTLFYIRGSEGM